MAKPNIHGAAAAEQAASGRATEEQMRAILSTVRRAVEEEHVGGTGKLSVKRSMEWFLEGRKNKALQLHHGDEADDAAASCSN